MIHRSAGMDAGSDASGHRDFRSSRCPGHDGALILFATLWPMTGPRVVGLDLVGQVEGCLEAASNRS
jgi:hypothetical protein